MKMAILSNQTDEDTKEWLDGLPELTAEQFKYEVIQGEQGVDAIEII